MARIAAIYRYPVKGLSAERLAETTLSAGEVIPWDRAFAIENGTRDFDPEKPQYFPKAKYLMLMRDERLASLETRFDDATEMLLIRRGGKDVTRGKLTDPVGRRIIEQFLAAYMKDSLLGPPRIVSAPGFSFSDMPSKVVSLINLASVKDLERVVGKPVDPLRFRGNLHVEGMEPWEEKSWVGRTIHLAGAEAVVKSNIIRCAATNVNPVTAERDMLVPRALESAFGANQMGVYLSIQGTGRLSQGDEIKI
jgi:uncharacterized protein YcbX